MRYRFIWLKQFAATISGTSKSIQEEQTQGQNKKKHLELNFSLSQTQGNPDNSSQKIPLKISQIFFQSRQLKPLPSCGFSGDNLWDDDAGDMDAEQRKIKDLNLTETE